MSGRGNSGRSGRAVPSGRGDRPRRRDVQPPERYRQDTFRAPARGLGRGNGGRCSNSTHNSVRSDTSTAGCIPISGRGDANGVRSSNSGRISNSGRVGCHGSNSRRSLASSQAASSPRIVAQPPPPVVTQPPPPVQAAPPPPVRAAPPPPSVDTNTKGGTQSTQKERPLSPWRSSSAKKKLFDLFMDETSWVHTCSYYEIYARDPDFQRYKRTDFRNNSKRLWESIKKAKEAVAFDRQALTHDMQLYPRQSVTERGHVRYAGSDIERLLKLDVKEGRSKGVLPRTLWISRPEYIEMPLHIFRDHKSREDRYLVETVGWQKVRNDKERKKHEKNQQQQEENNTIPMQSIVEEQNQDDEESVYPGREV
jgi:hypothetical protein